ncbi:MAG: 30S ribosome-binding factor RbfA [Pseudomonadota bacterium]
MSKRRFDHGPGPSQRQLRVGELIRRTLSDVLMRGDTHEPSLEGVSITVGEVRTSPDLKVATVYVLPLGGANAEAVLDGLKAARYELRRAVNKAVKLKFSPELRFVLDQSFDRMDETRAMLAEDRVKQDVEAEDNDPD